jgi:hypothetical protein
LTDYQIHVLRPAGLISRFDESANPSLYSPSRLDGSSLATRVLRASDIERAATIFCNSPRGERASTLSNRLRTALSQPGSCRVELVEDDDATPICLIDASDAGAESQITSLRSRAGSLGATVAMHMLWRQVVRAESRGADTIKFCDQLASDECLEALQEVGFVASSDGWVKRLHRTNYTLDDIVSASVSTEDSRPAIARRREQCVSWRMSALRRSRRQNVLCGQLSETAACHATSS